MPNTRARKSASPLEISPEKVAIKKLQVVDDNPTHPPEMSLSDVTVNMKSSRGKNILKAKEINAAKGKPKIAKLNETPKKKRTGVSKRKPNNKVSCYCNMEKCNCHSLAYLHFKHFLFLVEIFSFYTNRK